MAVALKKIDRSRFEKSFRLLPLVVALASALSVMTTANAFEIDAGQDWQVKWDNTINYGLGVRARNADDAIARNVNFDESDNKFRHGGNLVTNRVSILSEFDAVYKDAYGLRISASAWNDFAYNDSVKSASGDFVPGLPYSALTSYTGSKYSGYTNKYYVQGGQLLDAFVFGNFDIGDHRTSLKVGRQTQYWGNSLFQGAHSISYAQSPIDTGKALSDPSAQLKELFLPRNQIYAQTQITSDLTLAGQYFLEWSPDRLPTGGTYLGFADFLFRGPNRAFLGQFSQNGSPILTPQGQVFEPGNTHGNYGVNLRWSPEALRGSVGLYYRHLDETTPWAPLLGVNPATGALNYHMAYATGTDLFGFSLDKQIGDYSTGLEVSYRRNTALNSTTGPLASNLAGSEGARGDSLHVVANVVAGLTRTPFYDTGTAIAELAWGHKVRVTKNENLYAGAGTAACGYKWDGCSTNDVVNLSFQFTPQWLQALPGVDLSMPVSDTIGLYGNGATLNGGFQGSHIYSIGLNADIQRRYKVKLAYNGYWYRPGKQASYPGGSNVYQSGNGYYWLNDRGWFSLSFQTTF